MPAYPQAAFRFRPDDVELFERLKQHTGLGKADIVRLAIRQLAHSYGLPIPAETPPQPEGRLASKLLAEQRVKTRKKKTSRKS